MMNKALFSLLLLFLFSCTQDTKEATNTQAVNEQSISTAIVESLDSPITNPVEDISITIKPKKEKIKLGERYDADIVVGQSIHSISANGAKLPIREGIGQYKMTPRRVGEQNVRFVFRASINDKDTVWKLMHSYMVEE